MFKLMKKTALPDSIHIPDLDIDVRVRQNPRAKRYIPVSYTHLTLPTKA